MSHSQHAIYTQNLERTYQSHGNTVHALRDINLNLPYGELIALKGRSGSGKTTLLNCIGGLDTPTSGRIEILGQTLTNMNDAARTAWRRKELGFVFQSMGLLPMFSAYENLDLMMRLARTPRRSRRQRILQSLEQMGLSQWANHRPFELSGGQQQRIAIARAIVAQPKLILADEPTSELDSETTHTILAILQQLVKSEGMSILISTHDSIVDEYADRIVRLQDGVIL